MRPCLPPEPPSTPRHVLPAGTVDAQCHVVGPKARFPFWPGRTYSPPDAPVEAYIKMRETLGISRSIVVQPSVHGLDYGATVHALDKLGDTARGVVMLPVNVSDDEIAALHARGVRGVRLSSIMPGEGGLAGFEAFSQRLAAFGWHIDLYLDDADQIFDLEDIIRDSPVPVVLEHMGCVRGEAGASSQAFQRILDLLRESPHCWTKICSFYRFAYRADWADMGVLVRELVDAVPDKLLWGTNWPHVLLFDPPVPDDASLVDWFMDIAGADAHRALVDNPTRLYDFARS